MNHDILGYIQS